LLVSAVFFEHFSKNGMIRPISVVAAKIWYLKKCAVFIGPPCMCLQKYLVPEENMQMRLQLMQLFRETVMLQC